ncbi:MAG: hypothetical protein A2Z16_10570 [Chloroflexi bacterium RBG_16_54_18]|nr:MAG: hypothetical protein A2Z16_10570 [Chloroflexi bacterium RBG_16_54_18]
MEPLIFKRRGWLIAVAVASLGLYLSLALRYPLDYSLAFPRASWTSLVEPTELNAGLHITIYLCLTLLYLAGLHPLISDQRENRSPSRLQITFIFTAWIAFCIVLLFVAPAGESHDIFDYLFRGRMMTEYQANPLVEVPESLSLSTPFSRYLAWRKHVDTYGPIWETSSAVIALSVRQVTSWLGWWDDSFPVCPKSPESCRLLTVYITSYRLFAISLTGLSGWLIASIVRSSQAALIPLALVAWLWNPLTLIATAVGGHNDVLMLMLVLLSLWFLQRRYPSWAVVTLILAAHVKVTALIWLPAYALWIIWQFGWRNAIKIGLLTGASILVLSWLLYAPYGGWKTLPRMLEERSAFLANSIWQIVKYLLIEFRGWPARSAHQLSTGLPNWLFSVGMFLIPLWMFNFRPKRWRRTSVPPEEADQILWRVLGSIGVLYLLVGTFWFQHWYILWVITPAVLLPLGPLTQNVLPWLAFGALSSNVLMDFLYTSTAKDAQPIRNYVLAVLFIWTPVLLAFSINRIALRKGRED